MIKKKASKIQNRDWVIMFLTAALALTLAVAGLQFQALQESDKNQASSWLQQQVQINKLQACINDNVTTCDISTK